MGTGVSPQSVHEYRCQVHRWFMGTGAIPQRVHECSCQSTEGSWAQVLVDRGIIGAGVSPQRVHG